MESPAPSVAAFFISAGKIRVKAANGKFLLKHGFLDTISDKNTSSTKFSPASKTRFKIRRLKQHTPMMHSSRMFNLSNNQICSLSDSQICSKRPHTATSTLNCFRLKSTVIYMILLTVLVFFGQTSTVSAQYTEAGAWEGLENNTAVNVSSQLATTAFLPCAVRMIGDKQISWIRKRDWHVLTSGLQTFTNDQRFFVTHKDGADDWTLTIKFLQKRDNGTYECQISTASGIVSQFVHLRVIVPEAFILGNSEYHVQTGSSIKLFCIIEQSPIPPQYVSWKHNGRLLNYDKYRGGVSVQTEHGPKTTSHLLISGATVTDSGNYTCGAPNTESATVHVFVSQGDKTAAIQRRTGSGVGGLGCPLFVLVIMVGSVVSKALHSSCSLIVVL